MPDHLVSNADGKIALAYHGGVVVVVFGFAVERKNRSPRPMTQRPSSPNPGSLGWHPCRSLIVHGRNLPLHDRNPPLHDRNHPLQYAHLPLHDCNQTLHACAPTLRDSRPILHCHPTILHPNRMILS